jgi:[acyl-carrier-protein] S-malonyltransferase
MRKFALLFAGQGAQSVGMGSDLKCAVDLFTQADHLLGSGLSAITFEGPIEELTRTANCQPALYVHGLACLAALRDELGDLPFSAAAGLSLGEFTAHAAAGTFDFQTGLKLVARRGFFMDEACAATDGAMAALIGGELDSIRNLASAAEVDVANLNAPGQTVLSGSRSGIAMAVEKAKEYGVKKAIPLVVAGAYHSRLMLPAQEKLEVEIADVAMRTPAVPIPSNYLARPAEGEAAIKESLVRQVTGSVRWTESMQYLIAEGIEFFIELGPGGVLGGLMGRIQKGMEVVSISDSASLATGVPRIKELLVN